jgi:hypothetical protein
MEGNFWFTCQYHQLTVVVLALYLGVSQKLFATKRAGQAVATHPAHLSTF